MYIFSCSDFFFWPGMDTYELHEKIFYCHVVFLKNAFSFRYFKQLTWVKIANILEGVEGTTEKILKFESEIEILQNFEFKVQI